MITKICSITNKYNTKLKEDQKLFINYIHLCKLYTFM